MAVTSAANAEEPATPPECQDVAPAAVGEATASALAARCGVEVAVSDEADPFGGVYANTDGTFTLRTGVEPYRARDEQGAWAPIDTTLHTRPDGMIEAVNTVVPVEFSPGGDRPFATMTQGGKSFGLTWPGTLPAPTISGDTATYADVLPGVDLVVHAEANGFSHDVVVRTVQAAGDPRIERIQLGVQAEGLNVTVGERGSVTVTDQDTGEVFSQTPVPQMWDSPGAAPAGTAAPLAAFSGTPELTDPQIAQVGVEKTGTGIALVPDVEVLRGSYTQYPVIIDPMWPGGLRGGDWASAWSKYPTNLGWKGVDPTLGSGSTYGNAGAGQTCDNWSGLNCNSSTYKIRSFFRMNTEAVTRRDDRQLLGAKFKILQRHSADCNAGKAKIWHTNRITTSNDWNNQPTFRAETAYSTANANHGATCGGPEYAEFNVLNMAKVAKANKWYSFTIGMRAADESPSPDLAQWRRYDSSTARLELTYNSIPQVPTGPNTDGKGCQTSAPGAWVTTLTPRLTVTPVDADGGSVTAVFVTIAESGATIKEWSVPATANKAVTTTAPAGAIPASGSYSWTAKTKDAYTWSAWGTRCYFQVDTNPPATPTATLVTDDPLIGQPVNFRLDGPSDTNAFNYAMTGGANTSVAATNGTANITVIPPKTSIDHVLQVWAKDAAGNLSVRFDLPFTTRLPSETGYWPLAGDGTDKTGAHDLTIPPGATWVADAFGKSNSAMHLDGTGCGNTTGPIVDTSKSFTVSAWSRYTVSNLSATTILAQPGFTVHRSGTGRVTFVVTGTYSDGTTTTQAISSENAATVGVWQHIAATYDAGANTLNLYIDGVLHATAQSLLKFSPSTGSFGVGCESASTGGSPSGLFIGDIHDVRVFDGAVTPEQAGAIAAKRVSSWSLDQTGTDAVGGNNLTFQGDHTWVDDRNEYPGFAYGLALGGNAYAQSANTGIRTDGSFTVAAWVKLTDKTSTRTVVAQAATNRSSFYIDYLASADRWQFTMPSSDGTSVTWSDARSKDAPELDSWYHLTGVYDASLAQVRLYVNGELQSTVAAPAVPWHVDGPVLIGASGTISGAYSDYMVGSIDEVRIYSGVLDDRRIAELACDSTVVCVVQ